MPTSYAYKVRDREGKLPGTGRVKLKDLAVFSRQFATMINSGLSLLRS
jgi:type IV pilus assembly protein PilC